MPRYRVSVPEPGTMLYGDGDRTMVADTLQDARRFWEDYEGETVIYLHSWIGVCRVVYKRDVDAGDCHEDAEPGETTVDYRRDDGRALRDGEIRCWELGYGGPRPLVNRDEPVVGDIADAPVGVEVRHAVWGCGFTVARPLRHRTGWRLLVDFRGLYPEADHRPGEKYNVGGIGGSPRWVGLAGVQLYQSQTPSGQWPKTTWHVDIGDERLVEGVAHERIAQALGDASYARRRAEWEAREFAAWEREQTAVAS